MQLIFSERLSFAVMRDLEFHAPPFKQVLHGNIQMASQKQACSFSSLEATLYSFAYSSIFLLTFSFWGEASARLIPPSSAKGRSVRAQYTSFFISFFNDFSLRSIFHNSTFYRFISFRLMPFCKPTVTTLRLTD